MAYLKDDSEDEGLKGSSAGQAPSGVGENQGPVKSGIAPSNPKYTQSNYTSGRMILDKNKNSKQQNLLGDLNSNIDTKAQDVNNQFSNYQKNISETANPYTMGAEDIASAAKGDETKFTKIRDVLNSQPAQLGGFQATNGVDISDVNKLNTQAGVSNEFQKAAQKRGDFNYGQGQAALDATLFGKSSTGRNAQVGEALSKRAELDKQVADANSKAAAERAAAQAQIDSGFTNIKNNVTSSQQALKDAAARQGAELAEKYTGKDVAREQSKALFDRAALEAKQQAQQIAPKDQAYQDYLYTNMLSTLRSQMDDGNGFVDLSYDNNPFYNEDQANQFNRLNALLGVGDQNVVAGQDLGANAKLGSKFNDLLSYAQKNTDEEKALYEKYDKDLADRRKYNKNTDPRYKDSTMREIQKALKDQYGYADDPYKLAQDRAWVLNNPDYQKNNHLSDAEFAKRQEQAKFAEKYLSNDAGLDLWDKEQVMNQYKNQGDWEKVNSYITNALKRKA